MHSLMTITALLRYSSYIYIQNPVVLKTDSECPDHTEHSLCTYITVTVSSGMTNLLQLSNVTEETSLSMRNAQIEVIPRICMSTLGLSSATIHYAVSIGTVSGQWRPWSDCAEAQSDMGLRCPYVSEDTFSHGPAYLYYYSNSVYGTTLKFIYFV